MLYTLKAFIQCLRLTKVSVGTSAASRVVNKLVIITAINHCRLERRN